MSQHFLYGIDKALVALSRFVTLETTSFFIVIDSGQNVCKKLVLFTKFVVRPAR
jgi:hypothetical protein